MYKLDTCCTSHREPTNTLVLQTLLFRMVCDSHDENCPEPQIPASIVYEGDPALDMNHDINLHDAALGQAAVGDGVRRGYE